MSAPVIHVALVYWDPFTPGGVQSQVAGRIESLGMPGGPVRYTLFSARMPVKNPWPHIRVIEFKGWRHVSIALYELTASVCLARALARVHDQDPIGLVEVHATGAGPAVLRWAKKAGVPMLSVCHSLRFLSTKDHGHRWETALFYRWANRRTFLGADRVLSVSAAVKDELMRFGVPAAKIAVLHTAAPPSSSSSNALPTSGDGAFETFFAGRATRDKGLDVLVESFRRLQSAALSRPLHLTVAGFVPKSLALRTLAEKEALPISFVGTLSNREVRFRMAQSGAVVIPSRYDPCPVVCIEALIEGALVVATRVGGIPEIIEDGVTGLLVPPDDSAALATTLEGIVRNAPEYEDMRQRARDSGRKHTWEARRPQILDLYREVSDSSRARSASAPATPRSA